MLGRHRLTPAGVAGDEPLRADVLQSLNTVERHRIVPRDQTRHAYENRPLPIGYGQTISQPHIVARVYSIEIIKGLADEARERLQVLGLGHQRFHGRDRARSVALCGCRSTSSRVGCSSSSFCEPVLRNLSRPEIQ
jgi:protein-L-isoaspartate O-methyltransferase